MADQKKSGVLHFVPGTETQYARRMKRLKPCYMGMVEKLGIFSQEEKRHGER